LIERGTENWITGLNTNATKTLQI